MEEEGALGRWKKTTKTKRKKKKKPHKVQRAEKRYISGGGGKEDI